MYQAFMTKLLPTLSVPIGIALVLIPFSLLIGWNIVTVLIFWFILTPVITVYLPRLVSKRKNMLAESIAGILISYAIMFFMIFDHYQTDMFFMIMVSCGFNMLVITMISRLKELYAERGSNGEIF